MLFEVSDTVGVSWKGIWNSGVMSEPDVLAFLLIQTSNPSAQLWWGHTAQIMNTKCGLLASSCFPVELKKKKKKKKFKYCWTKSQHRTKFWEISRAEKKWLLLSDILIANYVFCCTPVLFQSLVTCLSCLASRQFINRSKNYNFSSIISLRPDTSMSSSFLSYKELLLSNKTHINSAFR